jgi:WD40 repeat protein
LSDDPQGPRRVGDGNEAADAPVLVAAGTQRYAREDLGHLDQVPTSLRTVVESLERLGITSLSSDPAGYLLDPGRGALFATLESAVKCEQVVIVYYTGHGLHFNNKYYLPMTDTQSNVAASAVSTRDLLEDNLLRLDADGEKAVEQPTVLVIFDCCFSANALIEGLVSLLQGIGNDNVWVMASANTTEYAQQGLFAKALADYLRDPKTGSSQTHLSLDVLVGDINLATIRAGADQEARWFPPARRGVTGLPPFFPNPNFHPNVAGFTIDEQRHWKSKVQAAPEGADVTGFYITGRSGRILAIEDLSRFVLDQRPGMAVITGSPGSGKSTLLALPALLSDAGGRTELLRSGSGNQLIQRAAELLADAPSIISVHARGMNTDQVAIEIGEALGVGGATAAGVLGELAAGERSVVPRPIIVDALDEAATPGGLVEFCETLAKTAKLRPVLGMRRHLLRELQDSDVHLIDLDDPRYRDPDALDAYVRQLLAATLEPNVRTPYRGIDETTITPVAEAIAEKANSDDTNSFLIARLLALAVRARPRAIDVADPNWREKHIPETVHAAFEEEIVRLGPRQHTARVLLEALAWAKGPGLPWENIWLPVAHALAEGRGLPAITDDDIRWLLNEAGAYITEDIGPGGRSVFRPFHDLLAAHLRASLASGGSDQRASDDGEPRRGDTRVRRTNDLIARALLATVPTRESRQWSTVHPYVRTYLAEHAKDAGGDRLASLLDDPDYLSMADPATLTTALSDAPSADPTIRCYRRASVLLGDDPSDNLAYLMEAASAISGDATLFTDSSIRPTYRTTQTWVGRDDSWLAFRAHRSGIPAMGFRADSAGQQFLVTVSDDRDSAIWDARSGRPTGIADADMSVDVTGFAGSRLTSNWFRVVRAAGHWVRVDRKLLSLRLFDVNSEKKVFKIRLPPPIGRFVPSLEHVKRIRRERSDISWGHTPVAFATLKPGQHLVAVGDQLGTVRVWDLVAGRRFAGPLAGNRSGVSALAFARGTEAPSIAVAYDDGDVRVWDLTTGCQQGSPFQVGVDEVTALEFAIDCQRQVLITGHGTRTVQVQIREEPAPSQHFLFRGHSHQVTAVAVQTASGGTPVVGSADSGGMVRLWHPDPANPPGDSHLHDVPQIAAANFGGQHLLAIGTAAGGVEIATADTLTQPWIVGHGHQDRIVSMAFGRGPDGPLLATADAEGTVHLLDGRTGSLLGEASANDWSSYITATFVACGTLSSGEPYVAITRNSFHSFGATTLWKAEGQGMSEIQVLHHLEDRYAGVGPFGTGPAGEVLGIALREDMFENRTGAAKSVVDVEAGTHVFAEVTAEGRVPEAFAHCPDGSSLLIVREEDDLQVWDLAKRCAIYEPLRCGDSGGAALWGGIWYDGRFVLAVADHTDTVRIWDAATREPVFTIRRRSTPSFVAVCANLLILQDDQSLSVLDVRPQ